MRGNMAGQILQLIYDRFYDDGGVWPTLGYLQRALNRQSANRIDAARIVQRVPAALLKPLPSANGYPAPTERLVLTAEGIERCIGSGEDIENFIAAIKWLVKMAERADLSDDQGEHGLRFTNRQLAEAVSLSSGSDQNAVHRLVAILQSEGWVRSYSDTSG